MVFSERAVINFEHGIRFRSDSLRSIGVSNKTQCWGVWTPNLNRDGADASGGCIPSLGHYHLAVSSFHPVTWPYLVRIRLALRDDVNSLSHVAHELGRMVLRGGDGCPQQGPRDLIIRHLDQAPTGFGHTTCTIVAEVLSVRRALEHKKSALDGRWFMPREPLREKSYDEASQFWIELRDKMFDAIKRIRACLSSPVFEAHFSRRLFNADFGPPSPWARSHPSLHRKTQRRHVPDAASAEWMYELPFHATLGGGYSAPIQMQYEEKSRRLRLRHPISYPGRTELRQEFLRKENYMCIAAFDPDEHIVRVVPIRDEDRKNRLVLLEVEYEAKSMGSAEPGLTYGLSERIARAAANKGFVSLSVLSKPRFMSVRGESGTLRFLLVRKEAMERPAHDRGELRAKVAEVADAYQSASGDSEASTNPREEDDGDRGEHYDSIAIEHPGVELRLEVSATEPAVSRVFISLNFTHPRKKNLIKLVKQGCHQCGLEAVIAETYTDTATEFVVSKINDCDAFLQILVEPPMDRERRRTWLDFEYGMASGRNLPRVRLVDVSSRPYLKWGEIVDIDRDRFCRPIDLSLGDKDLAKQLRKAIREIAGKIGRDLSPPDRRSGT